MKNVLQIFMHIILGEKAVISSEDKSVVPIGKSGSVKEKLKGQGLPPSISC